MSQETRGAYKRWQAGEMTIVNASDPDCRCPFSPGIHGHHLKGMVFRLKNSFQMTQELL